MWLVLGLGVPSMIVEAIAAEYEPGTPSTYLFDTGSLSPAELDAAQLASKTGWTAVPEDNVTHQFRGDMVMLNDRLIVVLRRGGPGAEVYCQTAAGSKLRAALVPAAASSEGSTSLQSARILENNPGAVMLAATFKTPGGPCELRYRLTAGQTIAEVQAGEGFDRLLVRCPARYVIVPDFFGNDMVFSPEDFARPRSRLRLPAENFCLGLSDQGSAAVMCVWQSSRQQAAAIPSSPAPSGEKQETPGAAAFAGWEIQAEKDKSIWVACLDGAGLWHQQLVSAENASGPTALEWKPPFSAKWRADLLLGHGAARSWFFHDPDDLTESQSAVEAAPATPPCCFEAGRAVVRLADELRAAPERSSLLVYALDRSRATPLAVFCPIDILRNTLGVGPCEYILKTEGLATETNPTPDNVMTWVEKQFARNRQEKAAEEIQDLLGQMVAHMEHARARIERYGSLARQVCDLCGEAAPGRPAAAEVAALESIGEAIERSATTVLKKSPPPVEHARQLADQVMGLTGQKNSGAECQKLGLELRAIGADQDRAMADCRMAARWLLQSAAMLAEDSPSQAALAGAVQTRAQQMLETK